MDPITLILLTVGFILLVTKILPFIRNAYTYRTMLNKIPGPGLPIVGLSYMGMTSTKEERFKIFAKYLQMYPDGILRAWVLHEGNIQLFNPVFMEEILPSTKEITKSSVYDSLLPWLGTGLLTSTGEKWFHNRKLITPAFHFNILEKFSIIMSEKTDVMIKFMKEELKKHPDKPIEIFSFAIKCALDTLCETAMGINLGVQGDSSKESDYSKALLKFSEISFYRFFRPWYKSDWIFKQTKYGQEYFAAISTMHHFTENVIRQKQEIRKLKKNADESDVDELGRPRRKAFLDLILDANEHAASPLSSEEIREQVDTFMFAGHDTTGAAISWTIFCLGNEPEIQQKVHDELDDVFGDSKEPATVKELMELKYLERVLKEVLRLFPSVPIFSRKLTENATIGGYTIPKDTNIAFNVYNTHRNPAVWPNATKFNPDRFLPENSKGRHPYAYIPFSAGPRNCIGQKYALLELKTVITEILRLWKVKSVENYDSIKLYSALILRPSDGIYIHFTPKN